MAIGEKAPLAAILAGGRATRMGGSKATRRLAGRPLIEHPLAALRQAGLEAVVVAKPGTPLPRLDVPVWEEPEQPTHPLAGVVCALRGGGGRPVLVVACDVPLITAPLLRWLSGLPDRLVVPQVAGRLHPLLARYSVELTGPLTRALARRERLGEAVSELGPHLVGEAELRRFGDPARLLFNVNSPADLAEAERVLLRS